MNVAQLLRCALTGRATARLTALLAALAIGVVAATSFAGDAIYGKVTEVRSAEVVVLDYGQGTYNVRIVGIAPAAKGAAADRSKEFTSRMVLGKEVHLRFEGRNKAGEMVGKLEVQVPGEGLKDVGLELVKAGLAKREPTYDYKYHELSAAEAEARKSKRGVWAPK
jgi:endonuclease YncB( thermonuclease family)